MKKDCKNFYDHKHPEQFPGYLLWSLSNMWQRTISQELKQSGLTSTQFMLLASLLTISSETHTINQAKLAKCTNVNIMMTSQVLRTLENKGLIQRVENPADSRANNLKMTSEGEKLASELISKVTSIDNTFFDVLGEDKEIFLNLLLKTIQANRSKSTIT